MSKVYFVIKLYMFQASYMPIIRSNWYVSCRLCDRFLAETGWNSTYLC